MTLYSSKRGIVKGTPQVLSWIDICAGLAAKTVARGPCVSASVDSVHFLRPCRLGSVAIIAAMVNRTFASSMEARPSGDLFCPFHLFRMMLGLVLYMEITEFGH